MECEICKDEGWVCENHPNVAWNYGFPECCGGACMMCTCHSQYGKGREADFSEDFTVVFASTKPVESRKWTALSMMKHQRWVPENAIFKSASECLEAFPDSGPACLVIEHTAYDKAIEALKKYAAEFEFPDDAPGPWLAKKVLRELGESQE